MAIWFSCHPIIVVLMLAILCVLFQSYHGWTPFLTKMFIFLQDNRFHSLMITFKLSRKKMRRNFWSLVCCIPHMHPCFCIPVPFLFWVCGWFVHCILSFFSLSLLLVQWLDPPSLFLLLLLYLLFVATQNPSKSFCCCHCLTINRSFFVFTLRSFYSFLPCKIVQEVLVGQ